MNSSPASLSAVTRAAVMLALILLVPSCASLGPPARTSGPSVSPEGIELVVAAQSCTQSSDTELHEEDLAEAALEVHVGNRTAADLTVRRDDFRLVTSDGYALRASSWGAADPLVVVGGETRAFELRFQTRGSLVCSSELRLEPRTGLIVGRRPVAIEPVRFVPWRSRTAIASSGSRIAGALAGN